MVFLVRSELGKPVAIGTDDIDASQLTPMLHAQAKLSRFGRDLSDIRRSTQKPRRLFDCVTGFDRGPQILQSHLGPFIAIV